MSLFEPMTALLLIPLVAYIALQVWQSGILLCIHMSFKNRADTELI
jgi:hypothetical protein